MKVWALFICLCVPGVGLAATNLSGLDLGEISASNSSDVKPIEFGNVLTSTSYVLPAGGASAGFQIAAVGLTDHLSFGTSPWLWNSYNMQNVYLRHRFWQSSDQSLAWQAGVFRTFGEGTEWDQGYRMKSTWLTGIWTLNVSRHFRYHVNLSVAHYDDDETPFSLRRPTAQTPTDMHLSSLFEVSLGQGLHLIGELGGLGLNQTLWQIHTGAALSYKGESWAFKTGYSLTGTPLAFMSPSRRKDMAFAPSGGGDRVVPNSDGSSSVMPMRESERNQEDLKYDFSVHPEITVQYFF